MREIMEYTLKWYGLSETFNSNHCDNLIRYVSEYWQIHKPFENCVGYLYDEANNLILEL